MSYTGATVDEAIHRMMTAHLEPIHRLLAALGADTAQYDTTGRWRRRSNEEYGWVAKGERDTVVFQRPEPVSVHRVLGEPVVLDRKPGSALIDEVQNDDDREVIRTITYSRSRSRSRSAIKSMTHGWSFDSTTTVGAEVTAGQEGIGSVKASIETSISVGAHGEYTSGSELVDETEESVEDSIQLSVQPGTISRVLQATDSARIKVPFTDRAVYDLPAKYVDFSRIHNVRGRNWKYLRRGKRYADASSSYYLLGWDSIDHLRAMLSGQSRDNPRSVMDVPDVRRWYTWLADEENRTIEYAGEAIYDEASATSVKVDSRPIRAPEPDDGLR